MKVVVTVAEAATNATLASSGQHWKSLIYICRKKLARLVVERAFSDWTEQCQFSTKSVEYATFLNERLSRFSGSRLYLPFHQGLEYMTVSLAEEWAPTKKRRSGYDTKLYCLWDSISRHLGLWITSSLILLPGRLWPRMVVHVRVPSMGWIVLFKNYLY